MPRTSDLINAAQQVKQVARDLPSGQAFSAVAHEEDADQIQGHLLDALIEIAMRLKAAGLSSDGILRGLSEAVSELDANS